MFQFLCDNQYGFRKDHSTSLAIIDLYDKICTAFDQGEFSSVFSLSFQKPLTRLIMPSFLESSNIMEYVV